MRQGSLVGRFNLRLFITLIFLLNLVDAALTYFLVVVLRAAKEINPLMNRLIEWNPAAFILFKVTFVGFLFVLIYRNIPMNMTNRQKWIALLMFGGAFLGMTIAVVMGLIASVLFIIQ